MSELIEVDSEIIGKIAGKFINDFLISEFKPSLDIPQIEKCLIQLHFSFPPPLSRQQRMYKLFYSETHVRDFCDVLTYVEFVWFLHTFDARKRGITDEFEFNLYSGHTDLETASNMPKNYGSHLGL